MENYKRDVCKILKSRLSEKQLLLSKLQNLFELSKIELKKSEELKGDKGIKGFQGLTKIKELNKEIKKDIEKIYEFDCEGKEYIYIKPTSLVKDKSTKLKLSKQTDKDKLFIKNPLNLPPKKRFNIRKK